jgi:hypothetical protein
VVCHFPDPSETRISLAIRVHAGDVGIVRARAAERSVPIVVSVVAGVPGYTRT